MIDKARMAPGSEAPPPLSDQVAQAVAIAVCLERLVGELDETLAALDERHDVTPAFVEPPSHGDLLRGLHETLVRASNRTDSLEVRIRVLSHLIRGNRL